MAVFIYGRSWIALNIRPSLIDSLLAIHTPTNDRQSWIHCLVVEHRYNCVYHSKFRDFKNYISWCIAIQRKVAIWTLKHYLCIIYAFGAGRLCTDRLFLLATYWLVYFYANVKCSKTFIVHIFVRGRCAGNEISYTYHHRVVRRLGLPRLTSQARSFSSHHHLQWSPQNLSSVSYYGSCP